MDPLHDISFSSMVTLTALRLTNVCCYTFRLIHCSSVVPWRMRIGGSWLVACSVPSRYLNQRCCQLDFCEQIKFRSNIKIFVGENALENIVCKLTSTVVRPQCVNITNSSVVVFSPYDWWITVNLPLTLSHIAVNGLIVWIYAVWEPEYFCSDLTLS